MPRQPVASSEAPHHDESLTVVERDGSRIGQPDAALDRPSLCMINYNGLRYLGESLAAVELIRDAFLEVLLVDDASTDDSVQFVQKRFPWVRVIRLGENRGPSAARNVALRIAQSDQVLLVDNDVCIPSNCPRRLREVLSDNPSAAVAMARSVYAARPDYIQFDSAGSHFIGLQSVEPSDQPLSEGATEPRRIGSLISACFLLDRKRLGRDVEFDDEFFIYLEDHDFGIRVRGRGYHVISVPDVVCLHGDGTEDLSIRQTGSYSKKRVFCLIRNRWLLICKNYRLRTLVLLAPVLALYEAAQLVIVLKKGWMAQWLAATWWMLNHAGDVLKKRRAVLQARVVPDGEILDGGPIPFRRELATSWVERWGQAFLNGLASSYWLLVRRWI